MAIASSTGQPSTPTAPAGADPQPRLRELDSLRGLASLAVVLHHFVLMWPAWPWPTHGPLWHRLHLTLLFYPLYAGHEAVMLFFVLSGLVLSFPYLLGRGQPYPIFLARRILRIYGPYLAALILSIAGAAIWHGNHARGAWAAPFWSEPVRWTLVLQHIAFLGIYNWQQFNFVIWSLIIEMRISIIFPLLAYFILRLRTRIALLLALALSLTTFLVVLFHPDADQTTGLLRTVHYTAFFIFGILLARHLKTISARFRSLPVTIRFGIAALSFALYNFSVPFLWNFRRPWTMTATEWLVAAGAIGFIVVGLNAPPVQRFLLSSIPRFLGRVSYSLYLIHVPVLLALTFSLRNTLSPWVQFPLYLAATLLLAWLFCLCVEEPFIRQGQRLGKKKPATLHEPSLNHQPRVALHS
ncbi:acyltransferase family protein [Tunturiibacter gelidoferens]|uniref:Peptidoglycan/LPS O-acetylase OafA/YrhL n=1 Tax=Tunturiibacter lichenicola TaxID=2051959 RepID=A0A7Y9NQW9_9BACT|nr:peptidoglycan/LPS O-acetylase OafA/YrhL [Edaphobacter lichenicola]